MFEYTSLKIFAQRQKRFQIIAKRYNTLCACIRDGRYPGSWSRWPALQKRLELYLVVSSSGWCAPVLWIDKWLQGEDLSRPRGYGRDFSRYCFVSPEVYNVLVWDCGSRTVSSLLSRRFALWLIVFGWSICTTPRFFPSWHHHWLGFWCFNNLFYVFTILNNFMFSLHLDPLIHRWLLPFDALKWYELFDKMKTSRDLTDWCFLLIW